MSSFKQQQEEKISKLEMQVREIKAVRKENIMLIKSLKNSQERVRELEGNNQPNYSHNETMQYAKNLNLEIPKGL